MPHQLASSPAPVLHAGEEDSYDPLDGVQQYLRQIGRVALLSATQEVELATRIADGVRSAQQVANAQNAQHQAVLQQCMEAGQVARQRLLEANLRLVVSIAKKYRGHGIAMIDLIQEGNLGLMRAAEKFDVSKGHRFSTYATWWIRQAVTRAIAEQTRTIRLPVHISESLAKLKRCEDQLTTVLARTPTNDEMACVLRWPRERVARIRSADRPLLSLDQMVGAEHTTPLVDRLPADEGDTLFETAAQQLLRTALRVALLDLSSRERQVLELRFGLNDDQRRTLEEVGTRLGMTRERARQIEADALRRLRTSDAGKQLATYLDGD